MSPATPSQFNCAGNEPDVRADVRFEPEGRATIEFRGRLDAATTGPCWRDLEQRLAQHRVTALAVDARHLVSCGAIGMALLRHLCSGGMTPGATVTLTDLRPELQEVLDAFCEQDWIEYQRGGAVRTSPLRELGRKARRASGELRLQATFVGQVVRALASLTIHPARVRWRMVKTLFERAGVNALPIISLISFLVGLIIASETAHRLVHFGAQILVAGIIGFSAVRDLGPLMTAILMAGRSGSAFAAELGTMKVNEELDALESMGLDPIRFLVVQRLIAGVALMPFLTIYSMFMGILGGTAFMVTLGYSVEEVYHEMAARVGLSDIIVGLSKSVVFGIIVAGVGCLRGMQTGQGPTEVGVAATRAVVTSILLIILADAVFAAMGFFLHRSA